MIGGGKKNVETRFYLLGFVKIVNNRLVQMNEEMKRHSDSIKTESSISKMDLCDGN